jgi:membrane protein implicated in regulation of membrane protease activity
MPGGIDFFYMICAAAGLLFTLLTAISGRHGHSGGHGHGHVSGHAGPGHGSGHVGAQGGAKGSRGGAKGKGGGPTVPHMTFGDLLSPLTIAVFVGSFGLLGLIGRSGIGMSPDVSLAFAFSAALLAAVTLTYLFVKIFVASEGSSLVTLQDCVGTEAEVVTRIDAGRIGSIAYVDKGTRLTLPARAEDDDAFGRGERVYICRMDGSTAWVKRERSSLWDSSE